MTTIERPMSTPQRVLFYSHDGKSFGHVRKLGRIIERLLRACPESPACVVSSSPFATLFLPFQERCDYIKLPAYKSRPTVDGRENHNEYLLPLGALAHRQLRADILGAICKAYNPTTVFMECNPVGKSGEMIPILTTLKSDGCRLLWGTHGYLNHNDPIIGLDRYRQFVVDNVDRLLVYVPASVHDVIACTPALRPIAERVSYVGYLCPTIDHLPVAKCGCTATKVFCQVGGGGIAGDFLSVIVQAASQLVDEGWDFTISTGLHMDSIDVERIKAHVKDKPAIKVRPFVSDVLLELAACDIFIGCGGYNTLCELIALPRRSIIVPIQVLETEQLRHASSLRDAGVISAVVSKATSPRELVDVLRSVSNFPEPHVPHNFERNGLMEVVSHVLGQK